MIRSYKVYRKSVACFWTQSTNDVRTNGGVGERGIVFHPIFEASRSVYDWKDIDMNKITKNYVWWNVMKINMIISPKRLIFQQPICSKKDNSAVVLERSPSASVERWVLSAMPSSSYRSPASIDVSRPAGSPLHQGRLYIPAFEYEMGEPKKKEKNMS